VISEEKKAAPLPTFTEPRTEPVPFAAPNPVPRSFSPPQPLSQSVPQVPVEAKPSSDDLKVASNGVQVRTPNGEVFRPTRRVREPIGGGSAQIGALFGGGGSDEYDEVVREAEMEQAKRRGLAVETAAAAAAAAAVPIAATTAPLRSIENQQPQKVEAAQKPNAVFRPSRRVR
jgi:hypothetical protein